MTAKKKVDRRNVAVTVGLIEEHMNLEQIEHVISEARRRVMDENLESLNIHWERERGYYDDISVSITLTAYRPETDEEMNLRIEQQSLHQRRYEENEFKEWQRLNRKYGNKEYKKE